MFLQKFAVDYTTSYTTASPYDTTTTAAAAGTTLVVLLLYIAVIIFMVVCGWKVFAKAGKPGWASIVPIYSAVVMLQIVGRPIWWIVLLFIPFVNVVAGIIIVNDLSKAFGKDVGFTIGLLLLPIIFYPMLAFGGAKYVGAGASEQSYTPPTAPTPPAAPMPPVPPAPSV